MKMIQDGASYYHCSGEWYRQVSGGKDGPIWRWRRLRGFVLPEFPIF